eukprot:CAMPEP_0176023776 /NCGR_PEP_ID=MMETSP0120_2-20121206/11605_1 /TAXON_ID=160619 /ORGANISM="Kryptoperidinium foliaceum, Strain CCMP 1326" /LENGTH=152 /DNA_ID=CAMNT_0017356943 /DNA_START=166 /DNA_END=624 /DNA_ORIENTATION=-
MCAAGQVSEETCAEKREVDASLRSVYSRGVILALVGIEFVFSTCTALLARMGHEPPLPSKAMRFSGSPGRLRPWAVVLFPLAVSAVADEGNSAMAMKSSGPGASTIVALMSTGVVGGLTLGWFLVKLVLTDNSQDEDGIAAIHIPTRELSAE